MPSMNDDQGGYVIGIILVVLGCISLLALFLLLHYNYYKHFHNYRKLHILRDVFFCLDWELHWSSWDRYSSIEPSL
jgi:hypothetical protein